MDRLFTDGRIFLLQGIDLASGLDIFILHQFQLSLGLNVVILEAVVLLIQQFQLILELFDFSLLFGSVDHVAEAVYLGQSHYFLL